MNALFMELFARAVLSLLLLGLLTGLLSQWLVRDYRRWACRREMQRLVLLTPKPPKFVVSDQWPASVRAERVAMRRDQLDGAATAQDKAARRLH